jgi:xanthine dehydrogenase YagS FAD-binding subunit
VRPFTITRITDPIRAITVRGADPATSFIAGGTDLLGLIKDGAATPNHLLDINALPAMAAIDVRSDGSLRIGALTRMSDLAAHLAVRQLYPMVSESLLFAASGQLRNMASIGGNIMQRTRCAYFRDGDGLPCNKREAGSGCSAVRGIHRTHAIFGWSEFCVATHPSDLAVALAALDAVVQVRGLRGDRAIPFSEFHRLPGNTPEKDNALEWGDLITAIEIPARDEGRKSHYLKVRDRQSYEFALVSTAAAVSTDNGSIRSVRLAMGGVAHKPWRLRAAEEALGGVRLADVVSLRGAISKSFLDARPLPHNAFKVELAQRCVLRALQVAGARA